MVRKEKEALRYQLSEGEQRFEHWRGRLGLGLGPLAFAATYVLTPPTVNASQRTTLAVVLWVLLWWVTEAVPLPVAALLGPTLLVVLHTDTPTALFSPFADPVIFLFLGSFILAEGTVASGLDRRLALSVLSWRWVIKSPFRIVAAMGFLGTAVSMWLSNTATAAMLYPLALAVARSLENTSSGRRSPLATALLLTIAYTASIGGIGTPVGSPPNLIAIGQLQKLSGLRVSFFQWMGVGVPVALLMLALCVTHLGRQARHKTPVGSPEALRAELPPFSVRECNVVLAFFLAVALWLLPGTLAFTLGEGHPWAREAFQTFPEGAVAILAATLLFVLPVRWDKLEFTLSWREAKAIDWGTLLLFGGGLSLGNQLFKTGLAAKAGESLVTLTGARDVLSLSYLFAFAALVLTETTSNTATATVVCPLAIAAAQAAGVNPVPPTMAAAVAASLAFMLPVSTPPNAIVYSSGLIRVTDMLRHGVFLDLVGLAVIPPLVVFLCRVLSIGTVG